MNILYYEILIFRGPGTDWCSSIVLHGPSTGRCSFTSFVVVLPPAVVRQTDAGLFEPVVTEGVVQLQFSNHRVRVVRMSPFGVHRRVVPVVHFNHSAAIVPPPLSGYVVVRMSPVGVVHSAAIVPLPDYTVRDWALFELSKQTRQEPGFGRLTWFHPRIVHHGGNVVRHTCTT